ncbi:MAG: hypothetical protein ACYC8T_34490 [Myxococcaceae bacterium]
MLRALAVLLVLAAGCGIRGLPRPPLSQAQVPPQAAPPDAGSAASMSP